MLGQPSEVLSKSCLLCARTFAQSHDLFQHLVQQHGEQCAKPALSIYLASHIWAQLKAPLPCTLCFKPQTDYHKEDSTCWAFLKHQCSTLLNLTGALAFTQPVASDGSSGLSDLHRGSRGRDDGSILRYARATLTQPEKRHKGPDRHPRRVASPQNSSQTVKMEKLVQLMSTLLIRHEDSLNAAATQDQFLIFCARGERGASHPLPVAPSTAVERDVTSYCDASSQLVDPNSSAGTPATLHQVHGTGERRADQEAGNCHESDHRGQGLPRPC